MTTPAPRTDWLAIIILYCAGLVAAMQFAKLSPVMSLVARELSLGPVAAGLSVSILGLVGVLFAVSVGAIANAVGLARALRAALFGGGIVALLGAFAPEANSFLLSRFLEGFSHLFIVVCTPALMANAAAPRDKPIALSLWGCFFGAGYALTSLLSPFIVGEAAWRNLLLAHGAAMLAVGLGVTLVTRGMPVRGAWPGLSAIMRKHIDVARSGAPLLLALTFFAYTVQFLAVLTFLNIFLQAQLNWPVERIGVALFIAPLWSLVFTLLSGLVVRGGLGIAWGFGIVFGVLAASSLMVFAIVPSPPLLLVALAVMMACFGLLPGLAFANMPRVARSPEQTTLGFSAIALFGNLGTFLGTPLLAFVLSAGGWAAVALTLAAISVVGAGLGWALERATREDAVVN